MKSIFKNIPKKFWRDVATKIKQLIVDDMKSGTVQEYVAQKRATSGGALHYSKQYKEAKQNSFRRKTTGGAKFSSIKGQKDLFFKNPKAKNNSGKRLSSYAGVSVVSNKTSQVNMMVTGQTGRGLHLEQILYNGVIMSYMPEDAKKIIGNEDMGRLITTLSEKNQKIIFQMFSNMLDTIIKTWAREKIVMTVGK